jgi:uncharacterized protein (TIGR02284 family)
MVENSNVVDTIRDLIKTCRDGEKGYKEAADHAKSSDLKTRFLQTSNERGRFADQLETELARADQDVKKDVKKDEGHVVGALHRAWIDIKEGLGGGDHAVLAWLEQGEDYAKGKYEKALKEALPPSAIIIVREQFQSILRDHDQIKSMRDSSKAA